MNAGSEGKHIFISYARKDGTKICEELYQFLTDDGFNVWNDQHIDKSKDFTSEIERAINNAKLFLVILTPDVERDDSFVRREISYAQTRRIPIQPIMVKGGFCPISIHTLTYIEFDNWEVTYPELRNEIEKREYPKRYAQKNETRNISDTNYGDTPEATNGDANPMSSTHAVERNQISRQQILDEFSSYNGNFRSQRNKRTISYTDIILDRPEVREIKEWILNSKSETSICLLTGRKGVGKSAVVQSILIELESMDATVLAIRADKVAEYRSNSGMSLEDSVQIIAQETPCIVMIDQLDNLADSLKRNQPALEAVLDLTAKLQSIPNARIVLACRDFELTSDPVLSDLVTDKQTYHIQLDTLPSKEVNRVLEYFEKPNIDQLTKVHQELLSWCIFLDIYARVIYQDSDVEVTEFNNLNELYERYWKLVFDRREYSDEFIDECENLIHYLVEEMQNEQTLELPETVLEKFRRPANHLLNIGFIEINDHQIAFLHQTLFAYCYARWFIASKKSITEEIVKSPQGFFQRPQVIHVFSLLRDRAPKKYENELDGFFFEHSKSVRFHLRQLLLQWIGKQSNPNHIEEQIMLRLYRNETTLPMVLTATRSNKSWLHFLKPEIEESIRKHNKNVDNLIYQYLNSFRQLVPKIVFNILSGVYKLSDEWGWRITRYLSITDVWDEKLAEQIGFDLLQRGKIDDRTLSSILAELANTNLDFGCKMLTFHLKTRYDMIIEDESASEDRRDNWYISQNLFPILDEWNTRIFFEEVTNFDSILIIRYFLDWFIDVISNLSAPPYSPTITRYKYSNIKFIFEENYGLVNREGIYFLQALKRSLVDLSQSNPDEFMVIVARLQQQDFRVFHDILVDVFMTVATSYSDGIYAYIIGDERRLDLEKLNQLLEVAFPNFSLKQRKQIEQIIANIKPRPIEQHTWDNWKYSWENKHAEQYRLLYFIPEDTLSTKARHLKYELCRKLHPYKPTREQRGTKSFKSTAPLPLTTLRRLSDVDYIRIMRRFDDSTGWDQPRDNRPLGMGGIVEQSREVERHALEDPTRLFQLSQQFDEHISSMYISAVIAGIAASENTPADMYIDIFDRFGKHITGETRLSICRSMSKREDELIPKRLLDLLGDWALNDPDPTPDNEPQHIIQILKGTTEHTDGFLHHAINSTRSVALEAYCTCALAYYPPLVNEIYRIIQQMTHDPSLAVRVMAMNILGAYLGKTQKISKTIEVIKQLIEGHELILSSHIVQRWINWLYVHESESAEQYIEQMLISEHEWTRQAGAEIICLNSLKFDTLQPKVDKLVKHPDNNIRKGVARICASNLADLRYEQFCARHLTVLMNDSQESIRRKVALSFTHLGYEHLNRLRQFFQDFVASPALNEGGIYFVQYLSKLRLTKQDDRLVLKLAWLILENYDKKSDVDNWGHPISQREFVMLLRNVYDRNENQPELQSHVMNIFDKLLEMNNQETKKMIDDDDSDWSIG